MAPAVKKVADGHQS